MLNNFDNIEYLDFPIVQGRKVDKDIGKEWVSQQKKYGRQKHSLIEWHLILSEEMGEFSKAIYDGNIEEVYKELIQVLAVAKKLACAIAIKEDV